MSAEVAQKDNSAAAPIDLDEDLSAAREGDEMETNWHERVESFDDMNLREELLRGIYSYGFERPSLIQQKAVVPLISYVGFSMLMQFL
jgi:superfamily II DNA/RNA helicase